MNKAEFISMVAAKAGTSKKDSEANLNAILAVITESLAKGQDVPFIGFGTFKAVKRPARTGRNPGTGQTIEIPESTAVSFKVGAKLKEAVTGKKAPEEGAKA
ncbi:MAG TPA: HU family DNA-binding protein [Campylobacterales bacterium]|nr:HU family DNA-binding protein [Campylobacterales bacterium]